MNVELLERKLAIVADQQCCSKPALKKFKHWLLNSEIIQRVRINPYEVAESTGAPVEDIIAVALNGVDSGMFDLHWLAHCPHCNMVTKDSDDFDELAYASYCRMCEVEFETDFLARIEVTFSLNKSIENTNLPPFCLPPPVLEPRINIAVMPGQSFTGTGEIDKPGLYRYFCPITLAKGLLTVDGERADHVQKVDLTQLPSFDYDKAQIACRPGLLCVELENNCAQLAGVYIINDDLPEEVPLEQLPPRLTGLGVVHHPEYRRLFGNKVLSDREGIRVSSAALMFTDIAGSTALYESIGNVTAYNVVRDHFEILFGCIKSNRGYVVKTIGDAVMASFVDNEDALRCTLQALRAFQDMSLGSDRSSKIRIKVGVHSGHILLVNLNGRMDFFGSTVNKAARIQAHAEPSEAVLSQEFVDHAPAAKRLLEIDDQAMRMELVVLKGISKVQMIFRLPATAELPGEEEHGP